MKFMYTFKDALLAKAIRKILERKIRDYGRIEAFSLDSRRKQMTVSILLDGEANALDVKIIRYQFDTTADCVRFEKVSTSRIWLNRLLEKKFDHPKKRKVALSPALVKALKFLL